jgi:hypothetical protein
MDLDSTRDHTLSCNFSFWPFWKSFFTNRPEKIIFIYGPRQGRQPHWRPFCTRGLALVIVDCMPPMRLAPFLQYPLTDAPSSSSISHSLFFNTKLSITKNCPSLDLTLQRPRSHISLWIDSPRYTPLFSTFYLEMHRRFAFWMKSPYYGWSYFFGMCIFDWWFGSYDTIR